jgi:hypothetical protein
VTLSDNGSPVPVEFGFEDLEEPEDSIPDSGPEPAPHRMPHVVGPPPAGPPPSPRATEAPASLSMPLDANGVGPRPPAPASEPEASIPGSRPEPALHQMSHVAGSPPPSPRATEAAAAPPGMSFDARGVVRRRRPAPASGSTRAPKAPRLAPAHTFSMQQHTFRIPVQQPTPIILPPPTTPIPHSPAGYDDWLQFYQGHKLKRFAAAQLERVSQLSLVNEGEYRLIKTAPAR